MNLDPVWKYVIRVIEEKKIENGEPCLVLRDKRNCTCKKEFEKTLNHLKNIYPGNEFLIKKRENGKWIEIMT